MPVTLNGVQAAILLTMHGSTKPRTLLLSIKVKGVSLWKLVIMEINIESKGVSAVHVSLKKVAFYVFEAVKHEGAFLFFFLWVAEGADTFGIY